MKSPRSSISGAATALLVALVCSGCEPEAIAAHGVSTDRSHAIRHAGCEEVVVPHGFALGWKRFNHRLSRWGVALDHEGCAATNVNITQVGGIFSTNPVLSDEPWARFQYQRARADESMSMARVSIREVVNSDGSATNRVEFDLEELGLGGRNNYVALIEGLRFDTSIEQGPDYPALYNPGRGYTTRGLGAEVDMEVIGDIAHVDYSIHFETGPSPERLFMNRTLPYARIGTQLDVLLIATDETTVTRGDVSYEMSHDRPAPFADPILPSAEERVRTVAVKGNADSPRGFYGLQKFHFELDFEDECTTDDNCTFGTCGDGGKCVYGPKKLGEYIREFSVGVRMADFDADSGQARFIFDGYTSNASSFLAFYPLRYTFNGGFAWIQAGGADDPLGLEKEFETGEISYALD